MPRYYEQHARGYDLDHEEHFVEIDGVRYVTGNAGSLLLVCPVCGQTRLREQDNPFECCWDCPAKHRLVKIALAEMDKFLAMWALRGDTIITLEQARANRLERESEQPWNWRFGTKTEADYPTGYVKRKMQADCLASTPAPSNNSGGESAAT